MIRKSSDRRTILAQFNPLTVEVEETSVRENVRDDDLLFSRQNQIAVTIAAIKKGSTITSGATYLPVKSQELQPAYTLAVDMDAVQ